MSNPKVFEFAKEIGLTPLALMDKIREWHLPVKSHMAELDSETLALIRSKLSEPTKAAEPEKKTVARKKPVAAAEKTATAAPAKKVVSTAVKTKTPAATAAAAVAASAAAEPVASAAKSSSTVVRRKKTDIVETKTEAAPQEVAPAIETAARASEPAEVEPENTEVVVAPVHVEVAKVAEPKEVISAQPVAAVEAPAPTPTAATVAAEEVAKRVGPARKKEVAIGASGVASEQKPAAVAARRNIVGRMDLSRVQPPPGTRGPGGPGGGIGQRPASPGFGGSPANRGKGNLRAGFFQAPIQETVAPVFGPDADRRRDDKKRARPGVGGEPAATGRELEEQPPTFDSAEFRKREMVFQPKKKRGLMGRAAMQTQITTPSANKRIVKVFGTMKVSDLAAELGLKAPALIKALMKNGVVASINMELDFDTIALIVPEFNFEAKNVKKTAEEVVSDTAFGDLDAAPVIRPPAVAVMGHVDHGKTSLLDAIRSAKVAAGEAGGITQHIGAYQVTLPDGYVVTFLDTPGHEAFTSMRARGAHTTDIAVIVVAADDGVMPQTAEAISHAKAANVPMIIAVNKMDKPGANMERIKQQLTEYEVVPEEWGGTTVFVPVSALKKTGIEELLEAIKLQAEVLELKANPKRSGTGAVIEARLEKGRGSVATILVQNGTVKVGQYIVAGAVPGRVRSLMNDRGERIEEAGPGMPVEVLGLDAVPQAGDKFDIVESERAAEEAAKIRADIIETAKNSTKKLSLDEIFAKVKKGDVKELSVVLKADVAGSMEALQGMFQKLSTDEVKVRIIHSAIGGITETDVMLASTAKGIIIGFNVRPDSGAQAAAKRYNIEIRTYSIVYELIDDMKKAMSGMLAPNIVEKVMGRAEVRNIFTVPKVGTIAGCMVSDGKIMRTNMARLIRDGKIVYEGKLASLKRFKDDAREVASGFECGLSIENFNDVKVGDVVEAFVKESVARELGAPSAEA